MTNKLYYLLLLACLTIAVLNSTSVLAAKTTQVSFNGHVIDFDVEPIKKSEENLLVPLRKISEAIGAAADWNHPEKQVTLSKNGVIVTLTIDEEYALINGEKTALIEKAVLVESRTLVPAQFVTKAFNVTVNWDKEKDLLNYESSFTIPILMYHHFMEGEASSVITDPEVFKEQLSYLKEKGYTTITDHDLLAYLTEGKLLPEKPLLITMDDGYTSNYTLAFPILKELNMKATIYVVVNTVGKLLDKYPHFTWEEAKEMYDSGLVEIQSHTFDSHKKAEVDGVMKPLLVSPITHDEKLETEEEYKERVYNDLSQAKQLIEQHVDNKVVTLSFPYGVSNETAVELGKKAGYEVMMTIAPGLNHKEANRFQLLRINVDGHHTGKDIEQHILKFIN